LKTLFIILLVYLGFKYLLRLFGPFLVKKAAETIKKKAEQQYGNQQSKSTVKEGETTIDKTPNNTQQGKNSVGEYVDFEEID
tara:strand:+ start:472 stop:717 length:246 start_codon:yes stop_codon:yes gene_type:complete